MPLFWETMDASKQSLIGLGPRHYCGASSIPENSYFDFWQLLCGRRV